MSESSDRAYPGRPNVCRNCGALVGAGERVCAQCGAPLAATAAGAEAYASRHDREAIRFARAVLTRPATFTFIFIIANVFLFLLTWLAAGGASDDLRFNAVLIAYGAKVNYLIQHGQWWRFVTPVFLHGGFAHLLMNMYGLWILGPYVERLYGSAKFVVFWVLTGVAGVVASYLTVRPELHAGGPIGRFLFKAEDAASVGASGALFGLIGVLFVFGIKFRHELPEGFKRAFGTGMLPMILLNLFIGYLGRGFIDNAAHLGGFFSGALVALFVGYKRPGERASVAVFWHALQIASLILVAVSFIMVALHFPKSLPQDEERRASSSQETPVAAYLNATNEGERVFIAAFNEGDFREIDSVTEKLKKAPRLDDTADALRNDLISLLERVRQLPPPPQGKSAKADNNIRAQREKLIKDFQAWQDRHINWAKENSTKYGLKIDEGAEDNDNSAGQNGSDSNSNRTTKD